VRQLDEAEHHQITFAAQHFGFALDAVPDGELEVEVDLLATHERQIGAQGDAAPRDIDAASGDRTLARFQHDRPIH